MHAWRLTNLQYLSHLIGVKRIQQSLKGFLNLWLNLRFKSPIINKLTPKWTIIIIQNLNWYLIEQKFREIKNWEKTKIIKSQK